MSVPHLPDDLTPLLLPFLLPPTPPLPPHLLSPLFRHRLLYLPPSETEMDRQLSPFPMPITSNALQQRLESLAGAYEVGPVKYAYDGESALARRSVNKEGGGDGVEMHFLHDLEEGWGFHGLRLPGQADEMGVKWVEHPTELDMGSAAQPADQMEEGGSGSLDAYAYTAAPETNDSEVKDYWAGFSPPQSPTLGAETTGAMIDEDEREREYWAQYSNGPSKASSPVASRRPSEMVVSGSKAKERVVMGRTEEEEEGVVGRHRSGTIMPSGTASPYPPTLAPPNSDELPTKSTIPTPASSPPPAANAEITLLRDRLRMKTLSLLQREWASFSGGGGGQDELEEKGMRWLVIGREAMQIQAGSSVGGEEEDRLRERMGMLKEIYEVYEPSEPEGFYRLVEQALRAGEGAQGEGEAGQGERGIHRNYSFEQATYWE